MNDNPDGYGARLNADALAKVLEHIFRTNLANEESTAAIEPGGRGKRPTPICVWGSHGIGKTSLIKSFATRNGWKFRYCAPAQFEEMGDLHGLPVRQDPNPDVIGDETTVYMPPDWVPQPDDVGPGILLLDDINRADDRILRGLMQLLQEFEMFSWTLPPKWQIVCTGNPEGGDYSVTTMDDAMLTRMLHLTMVFDVKSWARWALEAGVDRRGVAFVLTYPEVITGKRTTARSLTQFFDQIKPIPDLRQSMDLVSVLAQSSLDEITSTTFIAFVNDQLQQLIEPRDILDARNWDVVQARISELATGSGDSKRVDRLSTICTRLYLELSSRQYKPEAGHQENLVRFMLHPALPGDLRFGLHRDLVALGGDIAAMLQDKELAKLVLGSL
jgi:MoxR-like ATPase